MKYGFVTVAVKNMEESEAFYKEILGLKEAKRFSPRPGIDIMFLKDEEGNAVELIAHQGEAGNAVELIAHQGEAGNSGNSSVSIGFVVDDLDAVITMLKQKNVAISSGPVGVPGGARFVFVNDPNGVGIEFIEGFKL